MTNLIYALCILVNIPFAMQGMWLNIAAIVFIAALAISTNIQ